MQTQDYPENYKILFLQQGEVEELDESLSLYLKNGTFKQLWEYSHITLQHF
jgi:ABC-type multidrug transport system fused ATPase/permease subunit